MKSPFKHFLTLAAFLTLFGSYSLVHAREHEHEDDDDDEHEEHAHGGHHGSGEQKSPESGHQHGGKKSDAANLPPASTQQGVTYAKDIAPLLENACTRCHGEDKQKAKLRVDTLAGIMKGTEDGAIVIPGQSAKSPLVLSVARVDRETAMPPDRKPGKDVGADGKPLPPVVHFTPEQIGLIRAWIDQGAK